MIVEGRSIMDLAHGVTAEQHKYMRGELGAELKKLEPERRNSKGDEEQDNDPTADMVELLVDESIELIDGPRPNYAEAAFYLNYAASLEPRYRNLARIVGARLKAAVRGAVQLIEEAHEAEDTKGAPQ